MRMALDDTSQRFSIQYRFIVLSGNPMLQHRYWIDLIDMNLIDHGSEAL